MDPGIPVPGILPVRIGGLGNQIFIVVAGYITAKELKVPFKLFFVHGVRDAKMLLKSPFKVIHVIISQSWSLR